MVREIAIVASVRRPDKTALEEATTVIGWLTLNVSEEVLADEEGREEEDGEDELVEILCSSSILISYE